MRRSATPGGRSGGPSASRSRRGLALLVVLLVVVLLEVLVGELAIYGWLSLRSAGNYVRDLQGLAAADGGVRVVTRALGDEQFTREHLADLLRSGITGLSLGQARITVAVEDENAKLNLNLLSHRNPRVAETARRELLALLGALGQDSGLAGRIVEFLSPEEQEPAGDEGAAGGGAPEGASPPPARGLLMLEELRGVEGVTDELLFGPSGGGERTGPVLSRYLTCWGEGKVNLNTAPREVLEAVLGEAAPGMAQTIIEQRSSGPLRSVEEVSGFSGLPESQRQRLLRRLTTESDTYKVTVTSYFGPSGLAAGSGRGRGEWSTVTQAVVRAGPRRAGRVLLSRRLPAGGPRAAGR